VGIDDADLLHEVKPSGLGCPVADNGGKIVHARFFQGGLAALDFMNHGPGKFSEERFYQQKPAVGIVVDDEELERRRHAGIA
jgi:hypothetical protein